MGVFGFTYISVLLAVSQWLFLTVLWALGVFGVVELSIERNPWLTWMTLAVTLLLFGVCLLGNLWLIKQNPQIKTIFLISIGVGLFGLFCSAASLPAIIYKMGV